MAKIACCYNCVFAFLDREHTLECYHAGILNWPACANHPQSYGRMRRTPERGMCPNYRPKPPVPQGESVKQIALGDGYYAYVDAADFEWLSQWTWSMRGGYAVRMQKRTPVYMHRAIMKPPKGMIVDHKNRNKLDNTRDNLRNATHRQNAGNRSKKRGTYSRFAGVGYNKEYGKCFAQVYYNGERFFLGYHGDESEAARAHDYKAVELLGEFARVNFPDEWPEERRREVYVQGDAARQKAKAPKPRATKRRRTEDRGRETADGGQKPKHPRRKAKSSRATASRKTNRRGREGNA